MPKSFLTILFSLSIFFITAQENTQTLKVLSWNIYMLPAAANLSKEITKSHKKERTAEISTIMNASDYDIIIFQEAFHIPSRKKLAKNLKEKFPFQYGPLNKGFIKTNSGIFIVSKIPLKQLKSIQYRDCNSSDCLARKGSAIFEGERNGKTFQILGTHLNSTKEQHIRELQYEQLYEELLKPFEKPGVAQIICGDLNTKKSNLESYTSMLKKLDAIDIQTNSNQKMTTVTDKVEIDYILLRKNNAEINVESKHIKIFDAKVKVIDKLAGTLSDHLAVEVNFIF
jgi:endonuclease/exonuclease/phosphatase family metal-dependent hydrolase